MKARPTIFLSGVSAEFGTFRDAVENEIEIKGCFAENQPSFAPDYRTVEEMLRRRLHDADAVIHIVGFRFGAEPNGRTTATRRSYTQLEFDIAREMQKPVYVFFSNDASIRDEAKPDEKTEDAEATALQLVHREDVQKTNHLYYFFRDKAELCKLVAEIPPVQGAGFHPDISRIIRYAPAELIGRDAELRLLNDAWAKVRTAESPRARVLTFVALGGEGKTSLVAKWAADLAHQNWPGCDAVFAWSFYSQGTREQTAASSDLFLKDALTFFGDAEMAGSAQSAFDKGRRLAQLVGERRALLILDGVEPMQYAPTSPMPGEFKDAGLAALLKGLAANNLGLCLVTTRYSILDLRVYWQTTAPEIELQRLSTEAGEALLKSLGVTGATKEFETLVEDVHGHALTLNLLGSYLHDAHVGDIRKRDLVKLEEADAEQQGGHAFRVMDAYVRWFESEGEKGKRALAVLRLLGLFDRPATADCLVALLKAPPIPGLTEALVGISDANRNVLYSRLAAAKLLTVNRDEAGTLLSLDAHPLLREYFARQLGTQHLEAWRTAQRRLYEHLCETTKEGDQPTLEDMQPLYQAVAHGCHAGMQQEAFDKVYIARIRRSNECYSSKKLGAAGADLGAIACFFEQAWGRPSPKLAEWSQDWIHNEAATRLRSLGRLIESLELTRVAAGIGTAKMDWENAALCAGNLSELQLTLGDIAGAVRDAEQSVTYADRSVATRQHYFRRCTYANALHQAGCQSKALTLFYEAEEIRATRRPRHPLLSSQYGFHYCDLLLAHAERDAWRFVLTNVSLHPAHFASVPDAARKATRLLRENGTSPAAHAARTIRPNPHDAALEACRVVAQRAEFNLKIAEWNGWLLDIALDQLTLARATLYAAILDDSALDASKSHLKNASDGLRRAGAQEFIVFGLLTSAWLRSLTGARLGPESAQSYLDEAWEIAERGPMPLFLADIHLHRARYLAGSNQMPAVKSIRGNPPPPISPPPAV